MKSLKNMSKKAKMIIIVVLAVALVGGATGITFYAKEVNNKVEQTQQIYWSFVQQNTDTYNASELSEYKAILETREQAFHDLDIQTLEVINNEVTTLDNKVKKRIEQEALQKKYDDKKSEVEQINIIENATDDEINIFNDRKTAVFTMINEKKSFETIDEAINLLKQTNTDIENRKANETRIAQEQQTYYENTSNDYSYYGGGSSTGSGSSGESADEWEDPFGAGGCTVWGNCSEAGGTVGGSW